MYNLGWKLAQETLFELYIVYQLHEQEDFLSHQQHNIANMMYYMYVQIENLYYIIY